MNIHTSPHSNSNSNQNSCAELLAVARANIELQWRDTGVDLGAASIGSNRATPINRAYALPNLQSNHAFYAPGHDALGPVSGTLTISEKIFEEIFPDGRWPNIDFIAKSRPQRPTPDNDPLWGILNTPNIMALLRAVDHVRPRSALVIGGGIGLVESLIGQAMPEGSCLTVVDAGSMATRYPITPHGETYRRPISQAGLFGFLRYAEHRGLLGPNSQHASVHYHEVDSQDFLDGCRATSGQLFDFILVDGNHAYANAILDILKSFTLLKENGLLFVDDWNRLFHSQGVIHGAGLLAYHAGIQVYNLDSKGNSILVDSAGNPPNMIFASRHTDGRRPIDPAIGAEVGMLLQEIRER